MRDRIKSSSNNLAGRRGWLKSEAVLAAAGSVAYAIWFGFPILRHLTHGDLPQFTMNDWDFSMELHWAAYYTIMHFHQFPLWDPYKCGGMPAVGNPQSAALTPFLLPELIFGPVAGLRLSIVAHIALGFGGAYLLARLLGISPLGAVACAGAFAGSSWYYMHVEIGHICLVPGAYLPWPAALLYVSVQRRRLVPAALAGLVMALMMTEGGAHPLLWSGLILALLAPMIAIERRKFFPLAALAAAGIFTAAFGAIKLLPGLDFTGINARMESPLEVHSPRFFLMELFLHNQNPAMTTQGLRWGFYEYGAYVGLIFAALALIGVCTRFRRALPWTIVSAVLLATAAGYFGRCSPWFLIHKLPFYASLREPERWLAPFTLSTGVLAGFGVDAIGSVKSPWGPRIAIFLVALALFDSWSVSSRYLHYVAEDRDTYPVTATDVPRPPPITVFRQSDIPDLGAHMYLAAKAGLGTLRCYDVPGLVPPVHPLGYQQAGYRGEQYLLGSGTVALDRWTPNALSFNVDVPMGTGLMINQNYSHNWRLTAGRGLIIPMNGLLAVLVPAGKQRLKLVYDGVSFWRGLSITAGAFISLLMLWYVERRRGGRLAPRA